MPDAESDRHDRMCLPVGLEMMFRSQLTPVHRKYIRPAIAGTGFHFHGRLQHFYKKECGKGAPEQWTKYIYMEKPPNRSGNAATPQPIKWDKIPRRSLLSSLTATNHE